MTVLAGRVSPAERMQTVRKIIFSLLILLGLSSNAWAMRTPLIMAAGTNPSTSATNYAGFSGGWAATNDDGVRSLVPLDGVLEDLYVSLTVAPGAGKSYAFTVRKNGADTSLTCTVSDSNTTCQMSGSVSYSAGDTLALKCVPSGTPTATLPRIASVFNSRSGGGSPVLSSSNNTSPSTASSQSVAIQNRLGWAQGGLRTYMPTSGTISGLRVLVTTAPGAGKSVTLTINKNAVATSLTCTVSETANTCNDLSNSVSVVQGDYLTVTYAPTSTPASSTVVIGTVFTPTIDGESFQSYSYGGGAPDNTQDTYANFAANAQATSTTETGRVISSSDFILKNFYTIAGAASGTSKTWTYTVRKNSADTSVTCSRTGSSALTCSDNVNSVSLGTGDIISVKFSPSGTPTGSSSNHFSAVFYNDPKDKIYGGTFYGSTLY